MTDPSSSSPLRAGLKTRRRPRSFKQHLIRRLAVVVPAFFLMFVLVRSGLLDIASDKLTFNKSSWFDNTALVEHLRVAITRKGLTTLPRHCLVFIVNGDASVNIPDIELLGRHGNGCPSNAPNAAPSAETLFHIKINRTAQTIQTDAGSPNLFHPLFP